MPGVRKGFDEMIKVLGYNIYNAMGKKGVPLTELSKRINRDRSGLYKRLQKPEMITVQEVIKIGAALGVDWRELLEGVE